MDFVVDPASSTPPFEQLRGSLAVRIESGQLAEGTKLPPVRRMAEDLGLAANTVARAYKELEASGHVVTRGRNGTVVAPGQVHTADPRASRAADTYLAAMAVLGYDDEAAIGYLRRMIGD